MKKSIKWIIIALVCVLAFVGIYFLYGELKDNFTPDQFAPQTQESGGAEQEKYPAPDFTVLDSEGKEVKLSDYFGKPIVLNFWATWCYYCKMEMPDFNEAYQNNPDIQFLMVNVTDGYQETMDTAKKYVKEEGFGFPVFYDTSLEAANAYGASGLPMTVFIDEEGNMVTIARGMLSAEDLAKGLDFLR